MRTLAEIVRVNFFKLEINQRIATIWGICIWGKWLNLCKNNKLCGVLTCPDPIPISPALWKPWKLGALNHSTCENQQPSSYWNSLEFPQMYLELYKKPHTQRVDSIWFFWQLPRKVPIIGLIFIKPDSVKKSTILRLFVGNNQCQLFK